MDRRCTVGDGRGEICKLAESRRRAGHKVNRRWHSLSSRQQFDQRDEAPSHVIDVREVERVARSVDPKRATLDDRTSEGWDDSIGVVARATKYVREPHDRGSQSASSSLIH